MPSTRDLPFRLLNVFAVGDEPFSGNPLCVFEDARGLSDAQMQGLARQLNLSETTFVTPAAGEETAAVRIFTPSYEMPFAGHPTLGTAAVVSDRAGGRDRVVLSMPAGLIPVRTDGTAWTLQANPPTTREVQADPAGLARMVGLDSSALADAPQWVDTGTVQMLLPLRSAADVRAASADPVLMRELATRPDQQALVYLWAPREDGDLEARLFFTQDGAVIEDPATGSACANLGGWFHARGERAVRRRIHQGAAVHRPSILDLEVDRDGVILVSGTVREVGRGVYRL
jgi:trans-2,3-dihydro-3-hydroxyanthranilate isomerase